MQEQIEAELTRAWASVKSFSEAFGRREPAAGEAAKWKSSLCCLVASAPDISIIQEVIGVAGITPAFGSDPLQVVEAILASEVAARPPPPAPLSAQEQFEARLQQRLEAAEAKAAAEALATDKEREEDRALKQALLEGIKELRGEVTASRAESAAARAESASLKEMNTVYSTILSDTRGSSATWRCHEPRAVLFHR